MHDLISRQAAIDAFLTELTKRERNNLLHTWSTVEVKYFVVDMLEKLPSAQPERKKGKWIYGEDEYGIDGYHCDKCGFFVPWDYAHTFINYIEDYNFCPNCGADMRGEQDDEQRSN